MVDGTLPAEDMPMSDIFMNLELDLCDLAPIQILDSSGGTSFSTTSDTITSSKEVKGVSSLPSSSDEYRYFEEDGEIKRERKLDQEALARLFQLENLKKESKYDVSPIVVKEPLEGDFVRVKSSSLKSNRSNL